MSIVTSRTERCVEVLSALVGINSINPMGRSYDGAESVERQAIEYIEQLFAPHASRVSVIRQMCSPIHESLVVVLPGDPGRSAALFESHIDTVPADAWMERALHPIVEDGELFGLGACDDKGCLAAMILALLELLEESVDPPRTIILACAGDEEYSQTGIHRFLLDSEHKIGYSVVGEPTRLHPVVQHKGTVRWDIIVHGQSAHTSSPELGVNAILGMMDVIRALRSHEETLQSQWNSELMTGPMITVTRIAGGRTRNAVPDECTIAVDVRVLPGMNPNAQREIIIEHLTALPWQISHSQVQLLTPPLDTDPESPLCSEALSICRDIMGSDVQIQGAPYGTDAAWVGRVCPAIVLGPGDIRFAHAVDERISLKELRQGVEIYKRIMMHPFDRLS
jgi:acetylornithine deacetylase/succinyl-diaminopimelate desuccinylase-like protein